MSTNKKSNTPNSKNENSKRSNSDQEKSPPAQRDDLGIKSDEVSMSVPDSKPGLPGTLTREETQKILANAEKSEWSLVDQHLKTLEKSVQVARAAPLAGVKNPTTGMTPLMFAVKDNRKTYLDRMIKLGADVVARNNRGNTPLFLAVKAGNKSMCRELLIYRAQDQLRATTPSGDMALHLAARNRDIDMMRTLMDCGAVIDSQNDQGQTALHIASAEGDDVLVKYLYTMNALASITDHQDRTPMHLAAENGHAQIIELLVEKFKASLFERTKDGSTLMHIASLNGHAECASMFLKKGVYLHMPNKTGAGSIHTAAKHGHVDIINTLLQQGEQVDATTSDNYTALHIAVENGKHAVVEILLGYGADLHVRGGRLHETPLHIAARVPDGTRCALILLKSGANPNIATDDGQTPLHVATMYGNLSTLKLLLVDGGDPVCKLNTGETPLHLACRGCRADIVNELINFVKQHKGSGVATSYVNSLTNEGETALHYAAQIEPSEVANPGDDRAVVHALLGNGADVLMQTSQAKETPLHYCAQAGNNEILSEMIGHMSPTEVQKAVNKQSAVGWTPLHIAAHEGHVDITNNLLANYARVDIFDFEGRSALHLASEQGFLEVCDSLLKNQAFVNAKSRIGLTALHLAAMNGYEQLVGFLIKRHGAAIDVLTLRKQTPLHLAVEAGQLKVCKTLMELGANTDATDDLGQKPIHAAAMNNYDGVAQLFLEKHPNLVIDSTKDGNTCAHIAAKQGSIRVIEELLKFDKRAVIFARNKFTGATPLQLAAEGGHAEVVQVLVRAGASCLDENQSGFTAVHLAAQNGHGSVLEVMRSTQSLRISSKKLGVTALHVAAYFGQANTVQELLSDVPVTVKSDPPTGDSLFGELGNESGLTPLHLAAYSGDENVVRLLLNSAGVQVDAATTENAYNPLHLACFGGHTFVVGLLLSRSADLLHITDRYGRTGLHVAAKHGHYAMVVALLGQGAEIDATDRNGWTPLHCAAKAGFSDVVKLLVESGASPKSETNLGCVPMWFAASEGHNEVLKYLLEQEHDTYALMEDRRFVYNLMVCSVNHNNKPIEEFVLVSPAPVDTAAKLSNIYMKLSEKEKERAKDIIAAGKQCETMAAELLALAAGPDSAGPILTSVDRRNVEFLDVLIENEQKEVIAHTVVQRYLQKLWQGGLNWNAIRTLLLFILFIVCPPIWVIFSLPLGHKYSNVPMIKFMSYLTSHIYLMIFLALAGIVPIYPVIRPSLQPYWYEAYLLVILSGLLLFELTNTSNRSGLEWIKFTVLLLGISGVSMHLMIFFVKERSYWPTLFYIRNQLFAVSFLLASVQILDFLSFHYLFGPWAIIIGNLIKDLARFLVVLSIFVFGFCMAFISLNQGFKNKEIDAFYNPSRKPKGFFTDVNVSIAIIAENSFLAILQQKGTEDLTMYKDTRAEWTIVLFKITFSIYMLLTVIILMNLLIATMSDTYQTIQSRSDIEWKYGLSKLIRNYQKTKAAAPPLNLIMTWISYLIQLKKQQGLKRKKLGIMTGFIGQRLSQSSFSQDNKLIPSTKTSRDNFSSQFSESSLIGSQITFSNTQSINNVVDWDVVRKKYRIRFGNQTS